MEEVRAVPIGREELIRADVAEDGSMIFWTRSEVYVVPAGEGSRRICPEQVSRVAAAAFTAGDSVVEVVDAGNNSILRTYRTGTCLRRQVLGANEVIAGAARSDSGWILLVTSKRKPAKLERVTFERQPMPMVTFDSVFDVGYQISRSQLSLVRNQAILSNENWPFFWARLDTTGKVRSYVSGALSLRQLEDAEAFRPWTALPVVALDKGFLQTLLQPATDRRLLLLYDNFAQFVRATQPPASFGVLAASPRALLLVATRKRATQEVVLYRWKWLP